MPYISLEGHQSYSSSGSSATGYEVLYDTQDLKIESLEYVRDRIGSLVAFVNSAVTLSAFSDGLRSLAEFIREAEQGVELDANVRPAGIVVTFKGNSRYTYLREKIGQSQVDAMISRAVGNKGLVSFIHAHVRLDYSEKS